MSKVPLASRGWSFADEIESKTYNEIPLDQKYSILRSKVRELENCIREMVKFRDQLAEITLMLETLAIEGHDFLRDNPYP